MLQNLREPGRVLSARSVEEETPRRIENYAGRSRQKPKGNLRSTKQNDKSSQ